jgi:RNA polymerase sigma-70 factor (ECF subfamily)
VKDVSSFSGKADASDIFSQVYHEYYPKIYKYTLYRVGDHNTAEDLVSEIFEKVLVNYHTYNPQKGSFSTWIYTIANNNIINYYKKNHRNSSINFEQIDSKYQLEDSIIEQELKEDLLKAILCLDERQRNIIALKFGANLTNREIARMMDLTDSNVGTVLYRSLKHLRDILKEHEAAC